MDSFCIRFGRYCVGLVSGKIHFRNTVWLDDLVRVLSCLRFGEAWRSRALFCLRFENTEKVFIHTSSK